MYDRELIEDIFCTFENDDEWCCFQEHHQTSGVVLATHPGVELFCISVRDDDEALDALDDFARHCWDEPWPRNDREYPAWTIYPGELIAGCLVGGAGVRFLRKALIEVEEEINDEI